MRDSNGDLTGVLLENAGIEIMEKALNVAEFPALEQIAFQGLRNGLGELAKMGITSAVDARSYWTRKHDKAWEKALAQNVLTVKAILSLWAYPQFTDDAAQIEKYKL